jgi:hypothetical protein
MALEENGKQRARLLMSWSHLDSGKCIQDDRLSERPPFSSTSLASTLAESLCLGFLGCCENASSMGVPRTGGP